MYPEPKSSPWGKVQTCDVLCDGVFKVTTAGHGGIMVKSGIADSLLTPEAQSSAFKEGSYLCFEEDCAAAVAERELLDKGVWSIPPRVKDTAEYERNINESIQRHFPEYWQDREERISNGWTPLKQQLYDRLDKNLADYHTHIMGFDKRTIIQMADRISTVDDAHCYLMNHHPFNDESEVRYLLQFQNPLEIVADKWEQKRQDISDMSFTMWSIFDRRDAEKDYPLMSDLPPQPVQPEKVGISSIAPSVQADTPQVDPIDRIQNEAQRITDEFLKLTEPNSPNKTHFMVKLSPEFLQNACSKDMDRLFAAIPVKNLSFSNMKGEKGIFAYAPKGKSNTVQLKRSKASVLGDLANKSKEVAARPASDKPTAKKTERS